MNFVNFDLNLLRVFDALIRERSATRAGDLIGLSQPAVSNALSRLRHHFDDELFVRRGHEMVPTPRAENLSSPIQNALSQIEGAIAGDTNFIPEDTDRIFTLYGADFFSSLLMPGLYTRISRVAPNVTLRMIESASGDVESLLKDNVIDVALEREMDLDAEWVSSKEVMRSEMVVIAAKSNTAFNSAGVEAGETVSMELFCKVPHALRSVDGSFSGFVDDVLSTAEQSRKVKLAVPHFQAVAEAVSQGDLIATVPLQTALKSQYDLGLEIYQLPVPVPPQILRLYWHRRHDTVPAHMWFREQVIAAVKSMPGSSD
ncbi:MAG: LysR family transcriptional regulator [Roseibium sp.]